MHPSVLVPREKRQPMNRAWYPALVIVFWAVSTGWLFVAKILPSLSTGAPPASQALHLAEGRPVPVAWTLLVDDAERGWSISRADRSDDGTMRVASLLHLDRLPIGELVPPWSRLILGGSLPADTELSLEARGTMEIDAAGRLESFTSDVEFPGEGRIDLVGTVHDGDVTVVVSAGEMRFTTTRTLPDGLVFGDEFSPTATLPGLVPGRTWTMPVYGPLRPGNAPLEILHAEVGEDTTIVHDGRFVDVNVVTLRDDPSSHREPRARQWVEKRGGRVLRQEVTTMGRRLSFVRRDDAEAERMATSIAPPVPGGSP